MSLCHQIDRELIGRALQRLQPEEVEAVLAAFAAPPWLIRSLRLNDRDAAIRDALRHIPAGPTGAAREMAASWARYVTGRQWRDDCARGGPPPDPLRRALYRCTVLNGAEALCWRQVLNIARGHRG